MKKFIVASNLHNHLASEDLKLISINSLGSHALIQVFDSYEDALKYATYEDCKINKEVIVEEQKSIMTVPYESEKYHELISKNVKGFTMQRFNVTIKDTVHISTAFTSINLLNFAE